MISQIHEIIFRNLKGTTLSIEEIATFKKQIPMCLFFCIHLMIMVYNEIR